LDKELLARELKIQRAKSGLTQEDLAKKSGVALCTIAYIESKSITAIPRVDTLVKLEQALECEDNTLTKYLL
jgi:transcriptional regulator with XRE-family HTH domain